MNLDGVLFLAADTARSSAYGQAMAVRGMRVAASLLMSRGKSSPPGTVADPPKYSRSLEDIHIPDLSVPPREVCVAISDSVLSVDAENANDPAVVEAVRGADPRLVIYSGYGGQIVGPGLLGLGPPVLHIHGGWLPDYRGSTTIYYSLIGEKTCGTSAILLSPDIDLGPVVARRKYPPPPPGLDIDYLYDNAIRADLLADVLSEWRDRGGSFEPVGQDPAGGATYYVIHPVLKHLALLSIEEPRAS